MDINNIHTHTFTFQNVPHKFLPLQFVRFILKKNRAQTMAKFLNSLNPFSDKDILNRYSSFLLQGKESKQKDILKDLMFYYPPKTKFGVLSVDLDYMGAGKAPKNFEEQLIELSQLKKEYPDTIYPFICVDPRRKNIDYLVKNYIENHNFTGIKLYPPLGFFPFDERLDSIYKYAEKNQIPITVHCSRGGVYCRKKVKLKKHPITGEELKRLRKKHFTDYFTDPENYKYVLEKYKNLKICFGHFGGHSEWSDYLNNPMHENLDDNWYTKVKRLLIEYPNTYADVSYTLSKQDVFPLLFISLQIPELREKILFGSDFYMANIEGTEYKFSVSLRASLGNEYFRQIAEINPQKFLFKN